MGLAGWRDLAVVLLALEALIFVLVIGVVFYFLNRGMAKLQVAVKTYLPVVQDRLRQVSAVSEQVSQKIAAPIIAAETMSAKVRRWLITLRSTSTFRHRRSV